MLMRVSSMHELQSKNGILVIAYKKPLGYHYLELIWVVCLCLKLRCMRESLGNIIFFVLENVKIIHHYGIFCFIAAHLASQSVI